MKSNNDLNGKKMPPPACSRCGWSLETSVGWGWALVGEWLKSPDALVLSASL